MSQLEPLSDLNFAKAVETIRELFGRGLNVWSQDYVQEGGAFKDAEATAKADAYMAQFIQTDSRWLQAVNAMRLLVHHDDMTRTPNPNQEIPKT